MAVKDVLQDVALVLQIIGGPATIVLLLRWAVKKWRGSNDTAPKGRMMQVLSFASLLMLISGVILWYVLRPHVGGIFSSIYPEFASELGRPLDDALLFPTSTKDDDALGYQAWHEHATIVYFRRVKIYYILFKDGHWKSARDLGDRPEKEWRNMTERRQKSRINCNHDNLIPPYGGVAVGLHDDYQTWKDVGCVVNHCVIDRPESNNIQWQRFEHGLMFGPFNRSYTNSEAEVYVLLDKNMEWTERQLPENRMKCVTPAGDND